MYRWLRILQYLLFARNNVTRLVQRLDEAAAGVAFSFWQRNVLLQRRVDLLKARQVRRAP